MSLKDHPASSAAAAATRRVLLVILDGFGVNPNKTNNAVHLASTPRLDELFARYPHTLLEASGPAVGLPAGQIGNSEVGHITMGCGCVMEQDLVRINREIDSGTFFENPSLIYTLKKAREAGKPIHLLGLVSDGGVHSHLSHLEALIKMCQQQGVVPMLHAITDGRDTPPQKALEFIRRIEPLLLQAGGAITTLMGRYYAMDRDTRWERTERTWRAIARAEGAAYADAETAIRSAYDNGIGDEFIEPCVLPAAHAPDGDEPMILFNFRNDRPRQLIKALAVDGFDKFDRGNTPVLEITTMTEIDKAFPCLVALAPTRPKTTLAKTLSDRGVKQFHCAETEKYPHITFFFNGGSEEPLPGEKHQLIPSPKVATYDLKPEMSAHAVADSVIEALADPQYTFAVVNFANTDMVGHTAVPDPIIAAVETVDYETGRVVDAAREHGWAIIITADHGNCDEMLDPKTQQPNTQHTMNPVPCLIVDGVRHRLTDGCNISSIAPTVLDLMGIDVPEEMESHSVIVARS